MSVTFLPALDMGLPGVVFFYLSITERGAWAGDTATRGEKPAHAEAERGERGAAWGGT